MSVDPAQPDQDRRTCNPCRGTGRVISNLGGERREVTCPWCEGSGEFKPEHDAQEQAGSPSAPGQAGTPARAAAVAATEPPGDAHNPQ